jgi:hypothetical protein
MDRMVGREVLIDFHGEAASALVVGRFVGRERDGWWQKERWYIVELRSGQRLVKALSAMEFPPGARVS